VEVCKSGREVPSSESPGIRPSSVGKWIALLSSFIECEGMRARDNYGGNQQSNLGSVDG